MRTPRTPSYREHKPTKQAVVTLNGKDHYLGRFDTPESRAAYDALLGEWLAGGRADDAVVATIGTLIGHYRKHAERYYRKHGAATSTLDTIRPILDMLELRHGREPAAAFGPRKFLAMRQAWIDRGLARSTVNLYGRKVIDLFRWAVEHEFADGATLMALKAIKPLGGKAESKGVRKVRPVATATVLATLAACSDRLADMIRVQLLTGMRSGELLCLRFADIDRSGPVWIYSPAFFKTDHLDGERRVGLGREVQAILTPYERFPHHEALFLSPAQRTRRTPFSYDMMRKLVSNYYDAIQRACRRAFPHPTIPGSIVHVKDPTKRAAIRAHLRKVAWFPHQLRHSAATILRAGAGIEDAQLALGHSTVTQTENYAQPDWPAILARSADAMDRAGAELFGVRADLPCAGKDD